jgi:hypothetical protein
VSGGDGISVALRLAIVGSAAEGGPKFPGAPGKMSTWFLASFEKALSALDISTARYTLRQFVDAEVQADAAIFVYAEVRARRTPDLWRAIEQAGEAAEARNILLVHGPLIGRIVADKTLTHQTLSTAGIPMPRMLSGHSVAPFKVFSNEKQATHAPVVMINPGEPLLPNRYDTEWIDTIHDFRGKRYYVVLRAMCVGPHCLSIFVRARPVEQRDASVHNTDTPLDAALLNFLHRQIVVPRSAAIASLCARVAGALGLGFYAHDILPERSTERVLLCETGFKFYDDLYSQHIWPLRDQLINDDCLSDDFPRRSAECFAAELRKLLSS